ncbi:hypothetical protein ACHAXR_004055, partial [Thalassiosira sp. AJA248-18]
MSTVYSTEPGTTGRVVIDTTHGPIDINLWCKECPSTTRTFLQLCLDGYYDHMIFHRVLSEFLIQTGLTRNESMVGTTPSTEMDRYLRQSTAVPPSANSSMSASGDPLGLERKKLELNPRIRFNHRGQVAMAFPLEKTSDIVDEEESAMLRYQFFVTLDEAPFLDAKHVVFGTIAGATMFNALRIGRTDADEQTGIPTDMKDAPPRIKSVKVDYHPFEDLVVTADKKNPWKDATNNNAAGASGKGKQSAMEKRRKKRKGKRDLNVLSFGDEEQNYEDITSKDSKGGSMLSSHDVLSNESKFLSSKVDADVDKRIKEVDRTDRDSGGIVDKELSGKTQDASSNVEFSLDNNKTGAKEPLNGKRKMNENNDASNVLKEDSELRRSSSKEDRHQKSSKSTKSKTVGAVEARRARYLKSGTGSSANKKERLKREGDTMAKLFAFKNKVLETKGGDSNDKAKKQPADESLASRMAKRVKQTEDEEDLRNKNEEAFAAMPGYSGQVNKDENDQSDDDNARAGDWMGTKFKCRRHMDQDSRMSALDKIKVDEMGGDGRRMDDYVVLDEKRSGRDKKHRDNREYGHHDGS